MDSEIILRDYPMNSYDNVIEKIFEFKHKDNLTFSVKCKNYLYFSIFLQIRIEPFGLFLNIHWLQKELHASIITGTFYTNVGLVKVRLVIA